MVAIDYLHLNVYALQSHVVSSGTITVNLVSDLAGLTVPTFPTLTFNTKIAERVDILPGTVLMENVEIQYVESYETYAEGFWFKVLGSYGELQILLDSGNGAEYLFFGKIVKETITEDEIDLSVGNIQRQGRFSIVSLLSRLQDVPISYALDGIWADKETFVNSPYTEYFTKLHSVFQAVLITAFPAMPDIVVESCDIEFQGAVTAFPPGSLGSPFEEAVTKVGMYVGRDSVRGGLLGDAYWPAQYGNCFDLFIALCKTFLWIPRYRYDVTTSTHQIVLSTRGRGTTALTMPTPTQSSLASAVDVVVRNITTSHNNGSTAYAGTFHYDPVTSGYFVGSSLLFTAGSPNQSLPIDADLAVEFEVGNQSPGYQYGQEGITLLYNMNHSPGAIAINGADVFDYTTGDWYSVAHPDIVGGVDLGNLTFLSLQEAVAYYLYQRFSLPKRTYTRNYPTMIADDGSTSSASHPRYLVTTTINDGVIDRSFYAAEVEKNIATDELTVKWNEV